jgi:hypothetical protein
MSGIKIANGTAASAEATVDTNGDIHVVTPTDSSLGGFVSLASEVDAGDVLGSRYMRELEATEDYRLRVGMDSILFHHSFEGTNISRDRFVQTDVTATAVQTNGALTLNSSSSVTSGQGTHFRTYKTFPLFGSYSTYAELWATIGNPTATNAITEWGFGHSAGVTAQATDGAFFRLIGGGTLRAVVVNNSVDVSVQDITTTNIPSRDGSGSFDLSETNHYVVQVHNDEVDFWVNNVLVANIKTVSTNGSPTSSSNQPLFFRTYNSNTASAARQFILRFLNCSQGELNSSKPWGHQLCGFGAGAYQVQPGAASGPTTTRGASTTAGWPNSTQARGAGTWTATSAPATNSLGGQWLSPAISTLTSEADYPVFSYLNPAGTSQIPGKTLYITGVDYGNTVATVAASTNSINLNYIVGVGGTTSATNQTEAATVVATRGLVVDTIPFKATAAVGDYVPGGSIDFSQAPLAVQPGCYIQWIVRPFGTVTSNTLVVAGSVVFKGYHE